jgi:cytochrome c oxidase subunit 2
MEIYVVGKQWMWKLQHPEGRREINELHVPVNQPVKLVMTSEDAIHSFYLPEFRIKQDVLPGRYTSEWFEATKPGTYHLFCAEYCGTNHSRMIGSIYVMEQLAYQNWLSGGATGESMAVAGEKMFDQLGCSGCHRQDERGRCPSLYGVFGSTVPLTNGQKVIADEAYVRESILHPEAKIVAGYQPIMPTFEGQVTEEGLLQLIAYIKSMKREQRSGVSDEHPTRRTGP